MKLKLDENLSRHLKAPLEALGHDVTTVADQRLVGQPDPVIAQAARAEERMLLTLDLGLADIRAYAPGTHPGIIVFRLASTGPLTAMRFIERFVRETRLDTLAGCVVVVEPGRARVRRPPSSSGSEGDASA